jgi:3-phenylpropionate/cinnamic acid dioxygenase small subunit
MDDLHYLLDELAVRNLVARYARAVDERQLGATTDLYTSDCLFEFPSVSLRVNERHILKERGLRGLEPFDRTQHLTTNVLVDVDGDSATARADLFAMHIHDEKDPATHFDLGGVYDFRAVRQPEGWRISRIKLTTIWTGGQGPGPDTL